MRGPHRGARAARSRARWRGGSGVEKTIAPGKRGGLQLQRGSRDRPVEIILRVRMPAWKVGTAALQDGSDPLGGRAALEQFFGDPFVGDAPIGLWEAFDNAQALQPTAVDTGCLSDRGGVRRQVGVRSSVTRERSETDAWRRRLVRAAAPVAFSDPQQGGTFGGQACVGMPDLHPGRVTACITSLRLLIGEPSQAAQVTPIGASPVTAVDVGQLFADAVGHRGFDGCGTDVHPSLEIVGTGLDHHTGPVPVAPHGFDDDRAGLIQVDKDVASVPLLGIRMDVNVTAFPIPNAQKPHGGRVEQLGSGPQPFSWKRPSGLVVDQADQVEVIRHGRELAANRLQGEIESTVEHGPNFEIETTRRTMISQRTANSRLTDCLSRWVHTKDVYGGLAVTGANRGHSQPTVSKSWESETPRARANRNRFLKDGFRRAVSIPPKYVRCIQDNSARRS